MSNHSLVLLVPYKFMYFFDRAQNRPNFGESDNLSTPAEMAGLWKYLTCAVLCNVHIRYLFREDRPNVDFSVL
jgi:hypothetical protein